MAVAGLNNAVDIAAGVSHACALINDGTVKCWGSNQYGQIAPTSPAIMFTSPTVVTGISGATQVVTGSQSTCALLTGGKVTCFGAGSNGELGLGYLDLRRTTPADPAGMDSHVTGGGLGYDFSCAIQNGAAKCWGANNHGQLGNGTTTASKTPIATSPIAGAEAIVQIAVGAAHSCAVTASGARGCWGQNYNGQLGGACPSIS